MSDSEDSSQIGDTKFWHRKSCSNRIFIGPWDIRAPPSSPLLLPEQILSPYTKQGSSSIISDASMRLLNEYDNHNRFVETSIHSIPFHYSQAIVNSDSSIKAMHKTSRKDSGGGSNKSPTSGKSPADQLVTPSSGGTSFLTARSRATSTVYNSVDSQAHYLEHIVKQQHEDEDEEIDYSLLNSGMNIGQPSSSSSPPKDSSDVESIKTIRPNSNGKLPMNQQLNNKESTPPVTPSPPRKNKRKAIRIHHHHHHKKPLVWKRAGSVFVSRLPTIVTPEPASIPTGRPIKREPILCMRSATGYLSNEPTRYKAAKEARYDLLTEKWRQVELVLTSSYLTTYSSSVSFVIRSLGSFFFCFFFTKFFLDYVLAETTIRASNSFGRQP